MVKSFSLFEKWWLKVRYWEFWPFPILYFPVFFYYAWLAILRRSLFFFTASNPSFEFGGMMGEKKSDVYPLIPSAYLPKTKLFDPGQSEEANRFAAQLGYPVIVKPDIGARGNKVEKIHSSTQLEDYISQGKVPFLIQELVTYPIELGVFYVKNPTEAHGRVTSVVQKQFLTVTGDGESTVGRLLEQVPRAQVQVDLFHPRWAGLMDKIPAMNESILVESIGNHCRGTTFLNMNHVIDRSLHEAFDRLAADIEGFYFGRFDLRCQSIEDLRSLKNFKILELNGAGAEPGHIYQPGYPLLKAYKDILWHLKTLSDISHQNKQRGYPYWSFSEGMKWIGEVRKHNRMLNSQ